MTRSEFITCIKTAAIREDAFELDGLGDECYVLEEVNGVWEVFYSERGLKSGIHEFSTEADALNYLLEVLKADQSVFCADGNVTKEG